mgnify:CR=1 FL=1
MANLKRLLLVTACLSLAAVTFADTSPTCVYPEVKKENCVIVDAHHDIQQLSLTDVYVPIVRIHAENLEVPEVSTNVKVYHDPALLHCQYFIPERAKPYTLVKNVPNFMICNKAKGPQNRFHNTFYPPDIS